MKAALEMKGVVKKYGKRFALDGLSMTVPEGCIMGLVGSNGSGKTTALSAVAGLIHLQSGEINILNQGPFKSLVHAGRVSLLPQDALMPGYLRTEQFLRYLALLQGMPRENITREVDEILCSVNLADRKKSKIQSLSHGMRRRLNIAQAFMGSPDLILLDEPLNGLDPREVSNIRKLIKNKNPKQSLLISSHLLNEVEAGCDEVAFIEEGKCLQQGRLENIVAQREVVRVYLDQDVLPLARIKEALPADVLSFDSRKKELIVTSSGGAAGELNARLLKALLDENVSVLEVHRGHGLEDEYMRRRQKMR